jgi:hypothetical protein
MKRNAAFKSAAFLSFIDDAICLFFASGNIPVIHFFSNFITARFLPVSHHRIELFDRGLAVNDLGVRLEYQFLQVYI